LLNQKNYIIKAKRLTAVEIDEKRKISDFKHGMIYKITQNELMVTNGHN
jgi:hypothetical protein